MNNLPNFILQNIEIAAKTYYKMGGVARYFALPENIEQVQQTLFFCKQNELPCAILGSGSNSVYADGLFHGLILSLEKLSSWHWETEECLFVEAGVTNTEVAEICAQANRAGASWMYRMPGQMGGTVRMNARCYGGEISQIAKEILTLNSNGEFITYKGSEVFQGYKKTLFMDSPHVVVGVRLFFPQVESAEKLIQHMHECEADRHHKHHFYLPSCGSTFKNNYDIGKPSGRIFDELGLKGKKIGDAAVSEFHANFIWNCGNAKTEDMLNLSAFMRSEAARVLNAHLELEVQPVGSFPQILFEKCGMQYLGISQSNKEKIDEKWVGLFYFPDAGLKNFNSYPHKIFSSPFIEYHQSSYSGETKIDVQIIQLQSLKEAKKNPTTPFLKWETRCFNSPEVLFPLQVSQEQEDKFVDNLWHYSVSEVFFAKFHNPSHYLEFEMTPKQSWVALKFSNIRQRSVSKYEPKLQTYSINGEKEFGIVFSYENLEYVLDETGEVYMQCALSLGNNKYLLAPYWKQEANKKETPDFHQPKKFWKLQLR
ncbi:MAG: UDP-N-acetylmuramate dehydrogenase [Bdellovibrionota bacterium]